MTDWRVIQGRVERFAAHCKRTGWRAHAILCDPPYGLSEPPDMHEVLTYWLNGEKYEHNKGGFMGRDWDSLPPGPATWAALRECCHPGAYLFAFGGTRTADLLSIAIRLGGWERFDEIDVMGGFISYCYGQGFPKSHAVGKAAEKELTRELENMGFNQVEWID